MFREITATTFMIFTLLLSACSGSNVTQIVATSTAQSATSENVAMTEAQSTGASSAAETLAENDKAEISADALTWDDAQVVAIALTGDSINADAQGVAVEGSTVTITAAGSYSFSGSLNDGQIVVDTESEEVVRLILNGVTLANSTSAPVFIENASEVVLVLADNTTNTVSDAATYVYADPAENEPNAAIFSNADLTIYGSGTLDVTGNYNDAISSDDGVIIASGTINVTAVDDGIRGKDYVLIQDGTITVQAQSNGIKADEDEDAAKGYVAIENGMVNITTGGDAIQAETDVVISGGTFTITTSGSSDDQSAKGIKGAVQVAIDNGTFTLTTADDAIHSNDNVTINGGTFTIATGDDGVHADTTLDINGGTLDITQSYEGIESAVITINAGNIYVVASDDGVNVAGGNDSSGMGRPGGFIDSFSASSQMLNINGGYIYVDANGDGLDVNGTAQMSGGTVIVNGPTSQGNGALDYDAGFAMTGGYIVAAGSSGMAQAPGANSSVNNVLIGLNGSLPAGTLVNIKNSAGQDILTFAPTKQFQSIVFASADLAQGQTYTISYGGSSTGTVTNGLYNGGSYSGGTELGSFTVNSATTTVGTVGGGPGGGRRR